MPISAKPYRHKKFVTVKGRRMAYIEANTGNAIVFQHGNPTSSYLGATSCRTARGQDG
jgi:haloalkane dehalogenase